MLITPLFPNNYNHTNQPITSIASFPRCLPFCFLDRICDFKSCMRSITRSRRRPGNEAIGTLIKSEEAAASSASMLGTPWFMHKAMGTKIALKLMKYVSNRL